MRPLLEKIPQKRRTLYFAPAALGLAFLVFVVVGFATFSFLAALLVGPIAGVAGAWALYGWPQITTKSGKPLVTPQVKPFLFFPLFPLFAFVTYVVLGVYLTPILPPTILAYAVLAVALAVGGAGAYVLVGFPNLARMARDQYARVPPERRPFLFFPLAVVLSLLFYFLIGLALARTPVPLNLQPLLALPVGLALACVASYYAVGFPKPTKPVKEMIPEVPGRRRPLAFALTFLLAGLPLSYLAGLALSFTPGLPDAALLPLALLLGYAASLGAAALAWGTPRAWRRYADYKPGLPPGARAALFFPILVAIAIAGSILSYAIGLDLFPGLLVGGAIGTLVGLRVSGAIGKFRELRGESRTLLPELPDMVKPIVLLAIAFLVGSVLFVTATYAVPSLFAVNLAVALVLGLTVAVVLVEEATIRDLLAERREARARDAERRRRRAEALKGVAPPPAGKKA